MHPVAQRPYPTAQRLGTGISHTERTASLPSSLAAEGYQEATLNPWARDSSPWRRTRLSGGRAGEFDELAIDTPGAVAEEELAGAIPGAALAIRRKLMLDASAVSFEDVLGAHLTACDRVLRQPSAGAAR